MEEKSLLNQEIAASSAFVFSKKEWVEKGPSWFIEPTMSAIKNYIAQQFPDMVNQNLTEEENVYQFTLRVTKLGTTTPNDCK